MSTNITDLRDHLFGTLEALKNEKNPMDIDRAKVIADVSQVIINSAKVEVDYARVTGAKIASGFLDTQPDLPQAPSEQRNILEEKLPDFKVKGVTHHRM